jgi:hypothetical protein
MWLFYSIAVLNLFLLISLNVCFYSFSYIVWERLRPVIPKYLLNPLLGSLISTLLSMSDPILILTTVARARPLTLEYSHKPSKPLLVKEIREKLAL